MFGILLSTNNIPALSQTQRNDSCFLIVTTSKDWSYLQGSSNFRRLKTLIKCRHIEMPALEHVRNKMSIMSQGHKLASEEAFRNKAMGVYLTPDLILSDGAVTTLSRLGQQGKAAVLCLAVRFSEEGFLDELKRKGALKTDSSHWI